MSTRAPEPVVPRRPGRRAGDLRARLGRAVEILEERLTGKIDLDELARSCGLSRWYFMRVFQAASGLSVGEYVRMRKLSYAAEELAAGRPVLETANAWGYQSQAAFTRTFSRTFGVPPAAYARRVGAGGRPLELLPPFHPRFPLGVDEVPPPTLEHREPFRLVGLRLRASVLGYRAQAALPGLWAEWMGQQRWRPLGVHGPPECFAVSALRVNGDLEYILGMAAGPETPVPQGYAEAHVQGGPHALFTAVGPPLLAVRTLVLAAYGGGALERTRGRRHGGWDISTIELVPGLPASPTRCRYWTPLREPAPAPA